MTSTRSAKRLANRSSDADQQGPVSSIEPLLDAAEAAVLKQGIDQVTIDEMARMAGLSRATFYRRSGGREAVIAAVVRRHAAPFVKETEAAVAGAETFPARMKAGLVHALQALPRYPLLERIFRSSLSPYNLRVLLPIYRELVDASFAFSFRNAPTTTALLDPDFQQDLSEWLMRNFLHLAANGPSERAALDRYIDAFIVPVIRAAAIDTDTAQTDGNDSLQDSDQVGLLKLAAKLEEFASDLQSAAKHLALRNMAEL